MTHLDTLIDALRSAGLEHRIPDLRPHLRPALHLVPEDGPTEALATSRLGGDPDLPPSVDWPERDGVALSFLGQVRLDALAGLDHGEAPPTEGLLSFFYDSSLTVDSGIVLHVPTDGLVRREPPRAVPMAFRRFDAVAVAPTLTFTLPAFEELDANPFADIPSAASVLEAAEQGPYTSARRPFLTYATRMFGHPDEMQGGEARFEAVLDRDDGERYRYVDYAFTNREALQAEIRDLVLLLQATAEPGNPLALGGATVCFWIDRADLEAGRFDRAFSRAVFA